MKTSAYKSVFANRTLFLPVFRLSKIPRNLKDFARDNGLREGMEVAAGTDDGYFITINNGVPTASFKFPPLNVEFVREQEFCRVKWSKAPKPELKIGLPPKVKKEKAVK